MTTDQQRRAFEKWVSNKGVAMHYEGDGHYGNPTVARWWEAWQAATAAIQEDRAKRGEVVGWGYQHDETGRMTCVMNDGINTPDVFQKQNPRWLLIGPLYSFPPDTHAVLQRCVEAMEHASDWLHETQAAAVDLQSAIADARALLDGGKL